MSAEVKVAHFQPDTGLEGDVPIDLNNGFTLVARIMINPSDADGQQTIFLFRDDYREVCEVFSNKNGELCFGAGGTLATVQSEDFAPYIGKWIYLAVACSIDNEEIEVGIEIDGKLLAQTKGPAGDVRVSNKTIMGGEAADFKLAEIMYYQKCLSSSEKSQIYEYLDEKWK